MKSEISQIPIATPGARIKIKIELSSEINVTPFIARQKANVFLLTHLGNMVSAGEPKLSILADQLRWTVPIFYTIPKHSSTQVGELAMNVNSGEIVLSESKPTSISEIEDHVHALYQSATSSSPL